MKTIVIVLKDGGKNRKKTLDKTLPTPSEVASFWTPFPLEFPSPSVGGMNIFWNYTMDNVTKQ